jgi:hypothetical protein
VHRKKCSYQNLAKSKARRTRKTLNKKRKEFLKKYYNITIVVRKNRVGRNFT